MTTDYEFTRNNWPFECTCGERHKTVERAKGCRKCRQYLVEHDWCVDVTDIRTGDVVWRRPDRATWLSPPLDSGEATCPTSPWSAQEVESRVKDNASDIGCIRKAVERTQVDSLCHEDLIRGLMRRIASLERALDAHGVPVKAPQDA